METRSRQPGWGGWDKCDARSLVVRLTAGQTHYHGLAGRVQPSGPHRATTPRAVRWLLGTAIRVRDARPAVRDGPERESRRSHGGRADAAEGAQDPSTETRLPPEPLERYMAA